jgi:hypothetical protein
MQLIELIKYKLKSVAALCALMDTPTLNARISENSIERDPRAARRKIKKD